jgi:outer membrane protein OmpU
MKKLLLASTALVASAGVAAADVTVSGDGRMGVAYNSAQNDEFFFTSRARVAFTLSGQTDTGLAFGGGLRADNAGPASAGTGGSVFISGDFGRLTMGDTAGAAQFVVGHVAPVGLTEIGSFNESTFLGNPGGQRPTARYDITIDGFQVAVSYTNPGSAAGDVAAIAAGYSFDGFKVGIGYENVSGGNDHVIIGGSADIDGFTFKANYGRAGGNDQYSVGAGYSFDDIGVNAFYARTFASEDTFGIGASYDLGGGATLRGGVVRTDVVSLNADGSRSPSSFQGGQRRTMADFGIAFSF